MNNVIDDAKELARFYEFDTQPVTDESILLRISLLMEELEETKQAYIQENPEELVDGLVDLIVVAAVTLAHLGVDGHKAWNEVHRANMTKKRGINPKRPNSGGFDIYKPEGWQGPSHAGNHGKLKKLWYQNEHKEFL